MDTKSEMIRSGEKGSTMAEFAIISVVFFMIIFGILEFSRFLYTHNALTDAARRGARYAVIHHEADVACVKAAVVYGDTHVDPATCTGTGPALINGLTTAMVSVTYEGADADNNPATPPTAYGMNLGTATVVIQNYTFNLAIPFVRRTVNMGAYRSTLTAESAGEEPTPIPSP